MSRSRARVNLEIFRRLCEELTLDVGQGGLFHRFQSTNRLNPPPLSRIQIEARRRGLSIQTFHTFPDEPRSFARNLCLNSDPRGNPKAGSSTGNSIMADFTRIHLDPSIMGGKPCIKGTRMTVDTIAGLLSSGCREEVILELYPHLQEQDIREAVAFSTSRSIDRRSS